MHPVPVKPLIDAGVLEQVDVRAGTIEAVYDVASFDRLVELGVQFGDHTL